VSIVEFRNKSCSHGCESEKYNDKRFAGHTIWGGIGGWG
jgi:hypothetical protein